MKSLFFVFFCLIILQLNGQSVFPFDIESKKLLNDPNQVISIVPLNYSKVSHPRLILTKNGISDIIFKRNLDPTLDNYIKSILIRADDYISKPIITSNAKIVGSDFLKIITYTAFSYHITNNVKYSNYAISCLLAASNIPNWAPNSFLDLAEMTSTVSLGYDWLFDIISITDRSIILNAIKTKGLDKYISKESPNYYSRLVDINPVSTAGSVIFGSGFIISSLAIAESDPMYVKDFLQAGINKLLESQYSYSPDGAYSEGLGYWNYGTEYLCYGMSSLGTALNSYFGIDLIDGLSVTGYFPIIVRGPSNKIFNFSDSSESFSTISPSMFFLTKSFSNKYFSDYLHLQLAERINDVSPFHVLWYQQKSNITHSENLDREFKGGNTSIITMSSDLHDINAKWIAIKSGSNYAHHEHLELGNFVYEANGIRWVIDLGPDDYSLPNSGNSGFGGERWQYYRWGSASQNVPMLNGLNQFEFAKSTILLSSLNNSDPYTIVDFSEAYQVFSNKSLRKIGLINNRNDLLIEDNFSLKNSTLISWGFTTGQNIEILPSGQARLIDKSDNNNSILVEIMEPLNLNFAIESTYRAPPENPNIGSQRLKINFQSQGETILKVKFTPNH